MESSVGLSPISCNVNGVDGSDPLQPNGIVNKIKPSKLTTVKENEKRDKVETANGLFLSFNTTVKGTDDTCPFPPFAKTKSKPRNPIAVEGNKTEDGSKAMMSKPDGAKHRSSFVVNGNEKEDGLEAADWMPPSSDTKKGSNDDDTLIPIARINKNESHNPSIAKGTQKSNEAKASGRLFLFTNIEKEATGIYPLLTFAKSEKTKSNSPEADE